jgi:hypothetical protein
MVIPLRRVKLGYEGYFCLLYCNLAPRRRGIVNKNKKGKELQAVRRLELLVSIKAVSSMRLIMRETARRRNDAVNTVPSTPLPRPSGR